MFIRLYQIACRAQKRSNILLSRLLLLFLAALGVCMALPLSIAHLDTGETCPNVIVIPACYIVSAGYASILASAIFFKTRHNEKLFGVGWTAVFVTAACGTIVEAIFGSSCASGPFGIPQCVISLALAIVIGSLYIRIWFQLMLNDILPEISHFEMEALFEED